MGTTKPQRLAWLAESLKYLDNQDFPFHEKIISIDKIGNNQLDSKIEGELQLRGWKIIKHTFADRGKCMRDALAQISSDFIFYNEDDILVKMPKYNDVHEAFDIRDLNGRTCGLLSFSLGGTKHDDGKKNFGDLADIKENILLEKEDYLVFKRLEEKKDDYFFEFPALFARKDIFVSCANFAPLNSMEYDLTKAYFNQNFDSKYYKATICKHSIFDVLETYKHTYYRELKETAKLTRLLDENQGGIYWDLKKIPML